MSDAEFARSARPTRDTAWEDGDSERPFKVLSPSEARALGDRLGSVSPWRVVAVQGLVGLVIWLGFAVFSAKASAAWSALYGVAAVVVPNALMARGMTRRMSSAVSAATGFMFWEMLKIGVAVALLVIAAKVVPDLSWPVLLVTMVVCMKVNWFALLWRGR